MKRLTFLALFLPSLILLHPSAYSQGGWVAQNSGTTEDLWGLYFLNSTTGWAVGYNGTILHTVDGGITWAPQNSGVTNTLTDIQFASDGVTGWAVGDGNPVEGTIIHTTDGGTTWSRQVSGTPQNLFGVQFIDSNNGWVAGDWFTILHTTNGGTTWTPQSIASYRALDDLKFVDGTTGWTAGNNGDIFHTTNGGATWVRQNSGTIESLPGIDFVDATTGWVTGAGGVILHTTNGGTTWIPESSGTTSSLIGVAFPDANTGWAAGGGEASIILHTTDGGVSWIVQETGSTLWFHGISFVDALSGWVVGFGGTILHTTTGGSTGDPLAQFGVCYGSTGSAEPTNPGALITIDPLTGAGTLIGPTGIIGDDGPAVRALAIKSTGEMYAMSYTASSDLYTVNASTGAGTFVANTGLLHPGDIVFDANDVLYAVDETNILYIVDPVTGVRTVVGATGVTLGGLAYDPTNGTVYGSDNNDGIYTIDVTTGAATLVGTTGLGGNTPDIHFDQAGNLFGVKKGTGGISNYIAIDKTTGTGTVIGSTGFVAVVGLATRLQPPPAIPCSEISSFQSRCRPGGTIQARIILSNTNHTGEVVEFTIDGTPYQVSVALNGRAVLSIGIFGVGSHTVELTDPPGCYDPLSVRCSGGVAKPGDDFWDDDASWETPTTTTLLDNYPNPFNPSTTFRYGLSEPGQVTLNVYDMLGQLVKTIVNDYQSEGYHEAIWDGRNESGAGVASGIYIYRITAGSFTATKRMLLLK